MDDQAGEADGGDGPEDDDLLYAAVGLAHTIGIVIIGALCYRCCCRKAPQPLPHDAAATVGNDHLQPKKRLITGYVLLLCCGPVANAHHYYLGRIVHGLLATWTANFAGIGWLVDLVLLPYYVRRFNARYTAPDAPYDTSRRRLLCHLPMLVLITGATVLSVGLYLPSMLHHAGVLDIDRLAAQTEANPYDVLGIPHSAGLTEAKSAYRKESLRWHPDRNIGCGKPCEQKMSEITKAFDLVKKRRGPAPADRTWESWLEDIGSDWGHILEVLSRGSGPRSEAKTDL